MQLEETGMQQLEASGSLPLSGQMTTLAHPGALLGQQQATFSCPQSPDRAVSLGNLPSLGSLPPLGSPLIAAAVPAAEVPVHVAHFAFCRVPPPPPRQQLGPQRQQQQQLRSTQPPSQESCAGSRHPMLGGPPTRDGATSQLPPRQPASIGSLDMMQASAPSEPDQPGESELLRQFSGQLDLPLVDPLPQQQEPAAEVEFLAPQRAPQQPQRAQQRKEKKSPKAKQEPKQKQPQLKQKQLKKKQKAQGSKPAGQKPTAASPAAPQPAAAASPTVQQLLLQAGMDGFAQAMVSELQRQLSAQQAAEAAAWHRKQRQLLEEAQAEQRRQLELAQQAQLLQLEKAQLLWQSRRSPERRAAEPSPLAVSPAAPQLERQPSQALGREPSAQPSLGQRTLSAHLQQEERWASQRAVQQLWAQAAASLVGRSGSMEAGKLPGTAQQ
ncbi:hypothetical protein COHA_003920 [Chlorella ohadii]|uniref:Uncharacterized protein n=1 Tax=Chlorella ohadii TaxID=2649997 RepID=A0AAD5DXS8_9CHLO|nr:hypothetical protein COHA_003920 [Chlorella ohadii]